MPNFIRITPALYRDVRAATQRRPARCPTVLCGPDPDRLYIQILFHLLDARLAAVTAHLIAAEWHGRIHRLVAVDPHRTGAQSFREAVRLADIARPHAAPKPKGRGIAAADDFIDIGEWDRRDHWAEDLLLGDPHV